METKLKILRELEPKLIGKKKIRMVECVCECGNLTTTRLQYYKNGHTKSCGCLQKQVSANKCISRTIHGHSKKKKHSSTYTTWRGMVERITNSNHKSWKYYGGRGIKICDRWLNSFENFLEDMGERPNGLTLDRIDTNGNYEPNNCRWTDSKTQLSNRSSYERKLKK